MYELEVFKETSPQPPDAPICSSAKAIDVASIVGSLPADLESGVETMLCPPAISRKAPARAETLLSDERNNAREHQCLGLPDDSDWPNGSIPSPMFRDRSFHSSGGAELMHRQLI